MSDALRDQTRLAYDTVAASYAQILPDTSYESPLDLAALPFGGERFDGVLAWYSIIHSPPQELAPIFGEFRRVLRPGGVALIAYQAGTGVRDLTHAYGHDVELRAFLHQPPDVEAALHATGFTVDSRLDRGARAAERHGQCFILATRS